MKRLAAVAALVAGTIMLAPAQAGAVIQLDRGIAGARIGNTMTAVSTQGLGDRTARGIGVRSTRAAVEQRVPGVDCNTFMGTTICQRGEGLPGQRVTAFFIRNGRVVRVTVGIVID